MATFVVNSVDDVNDGNPNNGITTLREAIDAGNQVPGNDTITFNFGSTPQTIKLTSALPIINSNIEIKGTSQDTLTISGENQYRVFFIYAGTVSISGLTIANGYAKGGDGAAGSLGGGGGAGAGGGLFVNSGTTVTVDNVVFSSNQAIGGNGGGNGGDRDGGGGGGLAGDGAASVNRNGGQGGNSGLESLLGGSGGAGGQVVADYPVPTGYDYSVTNGRPGSFGGGGGGGGYTAGNERSDAKEYGLGGDGGDFGGGGGGGGNGGFGGGGGGGNGLGNSGGNGRAGTFIGIVTGRAGTGSSAQSGPSGGGGGGAGLGGAIFVNASSLVTLSNIALVNNAARGGQGGIGFYSGTNGDPGQGKGGAIYVRSGGTLKIFKDTYTFSGNDASDNDPNLPEQDNENIFGSYSLISAQVVKPGPNQTGQTQTGTGQTDQTIVLPTQGADRLTGTNQADRLLGLDGNDMISGGDGNDFLDGGKGKDTLSGGKGKDKFLLGRGFGRDLIQDFQDKQDKLALAGKLKFKDLDILQHGKGTLVSAGKEQLAFLKNVDADLITAADFTRSLR